MISLKTLKLQNFVTYKDQIFDFDKMFKSDDKILISGKNLDDNSFANDNGAGKSLIVESILFALFNRTTKNSNRNGLIGKHSKSMSVELTFNNNKNSFWIKRYRKDKIYGNGFRIKVDGEEIQKSTASETSDYLLKSLLNISYRRIINTSIFESQDERSRFVYLGDKDAKTLLGQIKGIDIFILCHELAKQKATNIKQELEEIIKEIDNKNWKLKELKNNKESLKIARKKFEENRQARINELQTSINEKTLSFDKKLKKIQEKIIKIDEKIEILKGKLIKQPKISIKKDKLNETQKLKSKVIESKHTISSEFQKNKSIINSLDKKEIGSICDSCGNKIKRENLEKYKKKLTKQSLIELKALEKINEQIKAFEEKEQKLNEQIKRYENKNYDLEKKIFETKSLKKQLTAKLKLEQNSFTSFIEFTKKQIQKIEQEDDLQKNDFDNIVERIAELKIELSNLKNEKKKIKKEYLYFNEWSNGYGKEEIQSYALKSTIIQLNKEIQRISDILTDGMIEAKLLTQKMQGNKVLRNIFELDISDLSKSNLPFKEWSKGQKKRIEVIISFALMSLEENLMAEVFLDELFDGIDRVGISKIISLLDEETKHGKKFIVFSHSDDVKALFGNRGVVTLKNGISTFDLI